MGGILYRAHTSGLRFLVVKTESVLRAQRFVAGLGASPLLGKVSRVVQMAMSTLAVDIRRRSTSSGKAEPSAR